MTPTVDAFRALARSSPWRWRTLHFRVRASWLHGEVTAYVERPGHLVVRDAGGRIHVEDGLPYTRTRITATRGGQPEPAPEPRLPHEVAPTLRPDGLVGERPPRWEVDYDDPMWTNYTWVAMLDPVELSHDVAVDHLRADEVLGREVWRADLAPQAGYEPRCGGGCCELLPSEAGWLSEGPENARPVPEGMRFADHHDVALDVQTGVVVRSRPVGGTDDSWLELDILGVDGTAPEWAADRR